MPLKHIPLREIPYAARKIEAAKRREFRQSKVDPPRIYIIHDAEGCYSGAFPNRYGYVVTLAAAQAIAGELTYMPDNTCHHSRAYTIWDDA